MKIRAMAKGILALVRSRRGHRGFCQHSPGAVVNKTLELESRILNAVDDRARQTSVFDDVKPKTVLELLCHFKLRLRQCDPALSPHRANGFYLYVAFNFPGIVARLDIVTFVEVRHLGWDAPGLFFKGEDCVNAFAAHFVAPLTIMSNIVLINIRFKGVAGFGQ